MSTLGLWLLIAQGFQLVFGGVSNPAAPPAIARRTPESVRIFRTPLKDDAQPAQSYTVECKVIAKQGMTITIPTVTLSDGEKVAVSDTGEKTFVVAVRSDSGANVPVLESITEGSTAEILVRGLGDDRVLLDLSFEARSANSDAKGVPQPVRIQVCNCRAIEAGQLGNTITADFKAEGCRLEAVVKRAPK